MSPTNSRSCGVPVLGGMLIRGPTHFRVLAPAYESDARASYSGGSARAVVVIGAEATAAGARAEEVAAVKAVVLVGTSMGRQANMSNRGDPGKRSSPAECGSPGRRRVRWGYVRNHCTSTRLMVSRPRFDLTQVWCPLNLQVSEDRVSRTAFGGVCPPDIYISHRRRGG
jgi:hypothetical protein